MTIFGTDISSYQGGLNVAHLPDPFVLMKCTEDVSYVDADYAQWLAAAKAARKPPVAYHFIGPSDPAEQAAHLAAHIIDRSVPVMVDFEDEGAFHPTLAQLLALDDAIKAEGLHVALNYFPKWKWGELGSPSLAALTQRGIGLVSSSYPNLTVAAAGQVYAAAGGDSGPGWDSYGGVTPLLWQFTDRAADGGQRVDMNAYRGTVAQLAAALNPAAPAPAPAPAPTPNPEDNMPAFSQGQLATGLGPEGDGAVTVILPPPPNGGGLVKWADVFFSLGADNAGSGAPVAHLRIAAFIDGVWTDFHTDFVVDSAVDRVLPLGSPLPNKIGKISVKRVPGSENVPVAYLMEAAAQ